MRYPISLRSAFLRNSVTLASGTGIAQLIPIFFMFALIQIYQPEDFGIYATFQAITALAAGIATLRYDLAVVLPPKDEDAEALVLLSILIAGSFAILVLVLIWLFQARIASLVGSPSLEIWIFFIPPAIAMLGAHSTLTHWLNRCGNYKRMSINRMAQTFAAGLVQVVAGITYPSPGGLIFGMVAGLFVTVAPLMHSFIRASAHRFHVTTSWTALQSVALRYKSHAIYITPAQLMGSVAMRVPVLLITTVFGATAAGHYAVAYSFITLPTIMVAAAIGEVYRQHASRAYNERGTFFLLFSRTLKFLAIIGLIPYAIIFFIAPTIFVFLFGETWRVAGDFAQILSVGAFFQFAITPLDKGAVIVGASNYIFRWNAYRLIMNLFWAALIMTFSLSVEAYLLGAMLINVALYIFDGFMGCHFSKGDSG